jgi:hypothetical protein
VNKATRTVILGYYRLIDESLLHINSELDGTSMVRAQSEVKRLMALMDGARAMISEDFINDDD